MESYNKGKHSVYRIQYHLIMVTKYRRPVLTEEVAECLKQECKRLVEEHLDGKILEMETDIDHIHLLLDMDVRHSPEEIVNVLKGTSSRTIHKKRFPAVEELLPGRQLWSRSYFIATAGGVTIDVLKRYVQNQPNQKIGRGRPKTALASLYPPSSGGEYKAD